MQHDEYATKLALINLIYPVGSIYVSTNSTSPETLFGGTWVAIPGRFLIGVGAVDENTTTYWGTMAAGAINMPAGEKGGVSTITTGGTAITTAQMPAHTHDKGTYSITGMVRCYSEYNKGNTAYDTNGVSGAFYFRTGTDTEYGTTTNMASGSNDAVRNVQFQANRAWTGASGSTGGGSAHTHTAQNIPPYLAVYMWERTA